MTEDNPITEEVFIKAVKELIEDIEDGSCDVGHSGSFLKVQRLLKEIG